MNEADGIVDRQVESMVRLLRRYEAAEIDKVLDRGYATARERLRGARREARQRVREAFEELRGETDAAITRVRAGDQARARRRELDKAALVLAGGKDCLDEALRTRWQQADSREAWVSSLLEQAAAVLSPGPWRVEHAPGWPGEEREAFAARAAEAAGEPPRCTERDDIAAGLRIGIDGASLDATLQGLLDRGSELEAQLLAEYYRLRDEAGQDGGGPS